MENQYRVLLYYKYVHIDNPEQFAQDHLTFCKELGLKGRILVAEEGINGTVSGTVEQTETYMNEMKKTPALKIWSSKSMKRISMRSKNACPPPP